MEYDGNDTLLRKFIYGPGIDEPICMIDVADSNAVYYYHLDGLGSVVALSDVNSVIVERYSYDVFGEPNKVSDVNNPYLFTGRRYDNETGLYYYRARYYNPDIGRFLQTDPIGYEAGLNLYTYCGNNPINYVDPSGNKFSCVPCVGCLGGTALACYKSCKDDPCVEDAWDCTNKCMKLMWDPKEWKGGKIIIIIKVACYVACIGCATIGI